MPEAQMPVHLTHPPVRVHIPPAKDRRRRGRGSLNLYRLLWYFVAKKINLLRFFFLLLYFRGVFISTYAPFHSRTNNLSIQIFFLKQKFVSIFISLYKK